MATWKVVAGNIQLFPHPTSDRLFIGKIGKFQVVVNNEGGYKDGDLVVFAPERSILPEEIRGEYVNTDTGASYLQGDNHDRVGSIRLRGELSEGATLPLDWVRGKLNPLQYELGGEQNDIPLGVDLSLPLGITKYIPTIPQELVGKVSHMNEAAFENHFMRHDVELFHMFKDEFTEGELVDLTEKVHGSQVNIMKDEEGNITLTSKYLGHEGFLIDEDETNNYWQAVNNSGLRDILKTRYFGDSVQVVAEMIPCQKKFGYGQVKPTVCVFKVVINGEELPITESLVSPFKDLWVPFFATVPFDPAVFPQFADGMEQVSGKELHIREGIVITPIMPRPDSEGHSLAIKFLNSKFKGAPTDFA